MTSHVDWEEGGELALMQSQKTGSLSGTGKLLPMQNFSEVYLGLKLGSEAQLQIPSPPSLVSREWIHCDMGKADPSVTPKFPHLLELVRSPRSSQQDESHTDILLKGHLL